MADKYVYFIRAESGFVKIGFASDPFARLRDFQTACWDRLALLGIAKAGPGSLVERRLHMEFAACRIRGEWFILTPQLVDRIREVCGVDCYLDAPIDVDELVAQDRERREKRRCAE